MGDQFEEGRMILRRTPRVLETLLSDLPDAWTGIRATPESWSPTDIVGHLIEGERRDWIPRARLILEGDSRAVFEPFDRRSQERWEVELSLEERLSTFAGLRDENLRVLEELKITPEQLQWEAVHPDPRIGRVTLGNLLATWAVHDLAHIAQISRGLGFPFREAVGPWNHPDYLRMLATP